MVHTLPDALLFPHFDLHMAPGTPDLVLKPVIRAPATSAAPSKYRIFDQLLRANFTFSFFAPHRKVGARLDNLPTVDENFVVHAAQPGVYLFQIAFAGQDPQKSGDPRLNPFGLVARLQVHPEMIDWWFGNTSITVARDDTLAHAQPTIFARFREDNDSGTDVVGDITGHGYITLTSPDAAVVKAPQDRLRGATVTTNPVTVTGTFAGQSTLPAMTARKTVAVRVVEFATLRDLTPIATVDLTTPQTKSNLVFLSEGFTAADKPLFDRVVARAHAELFSIGKPRHQPYGLLKDSFNVFSRFEASQEQQATCGYNVTDGKSDGSLRGLPIPTEARIEGFSKSVFTLSQLVQKVGLPMHNESRSFDDLLALWKTYPRFLDAQGPQKVDTQLVEAWKAHRSEGILQGSDTFFGTYLGARWADGSFVFGGTPRVTPPTRDDPTDPQLSPFITRLHDFFTHRTVASLTFDPRRYAPEVLAREQEVNPGTPVVSYLAGLQTPAPNSAAIGPNWVPDPDIPGPPPDPNADPKPPEPSRGLVVMITLEPSRAGRNINDATMSVLSVNNDGLIRAAYDQGSLIKRRVPIQELKFFKQPDGIVEFNTFIDTAAHELGHSFNLGDEYEKIPGNDPNDAGDATVDLDQDNVTRLLFIHDSTDSAPRSVEIDKVKWSALPRMRASARLTAPSVAVANGIQVTVGPRDIGTWVRLQKEQTPVEVRLRVVGVRANNNQQLPLPATTRYLQGLRIVGPPTESTGTFVLGGPGLPATIPTFGAGSLVFVPLLDKTGTPLVAVEQPVLALLRDKANHQNKPLNKDIDATTAISVVNDDPDEPRSIPNFKAPCRGARLVGVYEGAFQFAGGYYRPAGTCKMRDQGLEEEYGEFCFVCKWLIVNLVDPSMHAAMHQKFYPKAKKNG